MTVMLSIRHHPVRRTGKAPPRGGAQMRYLLLICNDESVMAALSPEEGRR